MKVVFVTRRQHNISSKIPILTPEAARVLVETWKDYQTLAHDKETTGWDPFLHIELLDAWYTGNPDEPIIVIDRTSVETEEVITNGFLRNKLILAHNAAFEARWNLRKGLSEGEYYCTMVSSQTISSGAKGLKFDIISELIRRKIEVPSVMDKETRLKFIGKDKSIVFDDDDIFYNAGDTYELHELKRRQQRHIDSLNLNFLIHRLRMPLVKVLAQAEITGFVHNKEAWLAIAEKGKKKLAELQIQLDDYLQKNKIRIEEINRNLAEEKAKANKQVDGNKRRFDRLRAEVARFELKGGKSLETKAYKKQKEQLEKCLTFLPKPLPPEEVNWSSPQQPILAIKALGIMVPLERDKKTYQMKESVSKGARTNWFAENLTHEHMEFMKLLDKYKKTEHNVKSFGEKWIDIYYNKITGKVHTCFRQAGTRTGRFASGNKKNGYFNLQQIPKYKNEQKIAEFRVCFGTDEGRSIATIDYTGCELVAMISLSNDLDLKKLSDLPDQHSYLGTKCWRAVYKDRYERTKDPKWKELAETYVMDKKIHEKERDKFKQSGAFPVVYGVKPNKVASIQGFSAIEGKIFIDTIEKEMPNVIRFVKEKAAFAVLNGFVIHNYRTNSRRWFTQVLDARKEGKELSYREKGSIESQARNSPIQGSNIDIIIEAIVTIDRWRRLYKIPIRFLGQVHDELIYDFPDDLLWIPEKLRQLMKNVAKRYLIPEIDMDADMHVCKTWNK